MDRAAQTLHKLSGEPFQDCCAIPSTYRRLIEIEEIHMMRLPLNTWLRGTAIGLGAFAAGGIAMMSLSAFASDAPASTTTTSLPREVTALPTSATPNCYAAPFQGVNYNGCDLRGIHFSNVDLTHASFESTRLDDAIFDEVILNHTSFVNASLHGASFTGTTFNSSNFTGSTLDATLVRTSHGDGLSTGLPAWNIPSNISVSSAGSQIDISPWLTGEQDLGAVTQGSHCTIPMTGDGFPANPVHVINCPSTGAQWGWGTFFGSRFNVDSISVMNLSHEEAQADLPLQLRDGFGRTRLITVSVHLGDSTTFTEGEPGEYWIY